LSCLSPLFVFSPLFPLFLFPFSFLFFSFSCLVF
jgi:hypothetical protein